MREGGTEISCKSHPVAEFGHIAKKIKPARKKENGAGGGTKTGKGGGEGSKCGPTSTIGKSRSLA